ncbi:hypothetical protein [Aurantibacillus circumpalustris]|uniref:hypothetical protein n=1 Tax=Aurantibacillus circumpalustris TaxID=3036359 RepID=UPI00295B6517|nr:hypothetical protein [Aurantibacillus circumpalustris]
MKLLLIGMVIVLTNSCITNRVTNVPNTTTISSNEKDRLQILGKAEGSSVGARVWILFIPLGWAGDNWVKGRAYKKALKFYPNADGLIDQVQTYHKTSVPLIVVTPQVKFAKVKGTAYHIRTDAELDDYLKNK